MISLRRRQRNPGARSVRTTKYFYSPRNNYPSNCSHIYWRQLARDGAFSCRGAAHRVLLRKKAKQRDWWWRAERQETTHRHERRFHRRRRRTRREHQRWANTARCVRQLKIYWELQRWPAWRVSRTLTHSPLPPIFSNMFSIVFFYWI